MTLCLTCWFRCWRSATTSWRRSTGTPFRVCGLWPGFIWITTIWNSFIQTPSRASPPCAYCSWKATGFNNYIQPPLPPSLWWAISTFPLCGTSTCQTMDWCPCPQGFWRPCHSWKICTFMGTHGSVTATWGGSMTGKELHRVRFFTFSLQIIENFFHCSIVKRQIKWGFINSNIMRW